MQYLILDYETRSEVDLKKVGAYEYAKDVSTQILCVAWRIGTREQLKYQLRNRLPANVYSPAFPDARNLTQLRKHLLNQKCGLVAHNAFFEQMITKFVLKMPDISSERWVCTASMAAALALPRNLENVCLALNLPIKKDTDGRRLVLKYCKPRKVLKNDFSKWHSSASDLRRIMEYCKTDVDAETLLFLTLPELNATERKVWLLDQKINFRGFKVDQELILSALELIDQETKALDFETYQITNGQVSTTNQRDAALKWLNEQNVELPDLQKKTVENALLNNELSAKVKRFLEIRKAASKTSTAKFQAFKARSKSDSRVRDNLVYHGARTGRWAGAGVQPQNFPRGTIKNTTEAAEDIKIRSLEWLRCLYGSPMNVFSSCLRAVSIPSEGNEFFCADYSAIEARVLFWVAEHFRGIKAFTENRPIYEEMAAAIYRVPEVNQVTKDQRSLGKVAILGAGYGMGAAKFVQTCKAFGIQIDETMARVAIETYRIQHAPVKTLWSNFERAAIEVVQAPSKSIKINCTKWFIKNDFLWCELPSGRKLAYYKPEIRFELTSWGEKRPVLYHYSVNSLTKKWELASTYGGKLTENVVQAVSRDLMAEAMLRIENAGFKIVLSVHDELLAERKKNESTLAEFENLMSETPEWAKGLPIKVEGWRGERYRK